METGGRYEKIKCLCFISKETRTDWTRNEAPHVGCSGVKARVRLLGHVQRRGSENISRRMQRLELAGRRLRRRAKRRFLDVVKDMKLL